MLSPRPPTEVALVLTFSFQCDQKACPASDSTENMLVLSLEEGLRLRNQRKVISLSFKETLSVKLGHKLLQPTDNLSYNPGPQVVEGET